MQRTMRKPIQKILLTTAVLAAALLALSFSGRTTVGPEEIGVRLGPGDTVTIFQAGERPLILPGVHRFIRLTRRPVAFVMAGVGGIVVTTPAVEKSIDCRLRYQIDDAARFIERFGTDRPQALLEDRLRQAVRDAFTRRLGDDPHALDSPLTRIPLIAETHTSLDTALRVDGVRLLSIELLGWR